ncbi:MAG TPA: putative lipid II flippase FtsW [Thermomicrobiales bacterium]|nr:putative lipid II flippase FtsW [Thermomicrobiales bacterium]
MRLWRKAPTRAKTIYHEPDWWLLATLTTLVMFGLVMVYSSSFGLAISEGGSRYEYLIRQAIYTAIGTVGLLVAMRIDYHRMRDLAFPAMIATLGVLAALVFVPGVGTEIYGAKSWIFVGPVSIQPSEAAKLALVLYLASWLCGKGTRVRSFSYGMVQFAIVMGLLIGLVMLQPDLGTSILLATVGMAMFFVAGANLVQFVSSVLAGGSIFLALALSASYRRDRLLLFLDPESDLRNLGWQLFQARLALGSGGLFGLGLGASRQKFSWLPAPHNDAIFAVIGEELGLVGCFFLLMLFGALGIRGYRIAKRAPDAFGALIAVGITTWLIFQAMFNIGGVVTAIPFTGIPMPFVSYGGSSLIVAMTAMGVLLNVSRQTVEVSRPRVRQSSNDEERPERVPLPDRRPVPEGVKTFGRASHSEGGGQW